MLHKNISNRLKYNVMFYYYLWSRRGYFHRHVSFFRQRMCISACTWAWDWGLGYMDRGGVKTGAYTYPPRPPMMATEVGGTYPSGMHSCFYQFSCWTRCQKWEKVPRMWKLPGPLSGLQTYIYVHFTHMISLHNMGIFLCKKILVPFPIRIRYWI